jgi:multisubunit Na+/H+ antiporter MnhE subunit
MGFASASWVLLVALYLVLAGQVSATEVVAGAAAGLAATVLSVAERREGERRYAFRGTPWGRVLGRPALALVTDSAKVAGALARVALRGADAQPGAAVRQPFAPGEDDDPREAARRGIVALAVSLTPNSYVLRTMPGCDALLLHRLAERPPSPDREWPV